MAKYKDVIVTAGSGGFGGPLHLHPNEKQNKIVNITGGVISPVAKRLAEMTGCELVDGFKTSVPDAEILAVVIDCGGTLRCGIYPQKRIQTINLNPTGPSGRSRSSSNRISTSRLCAKRIWLLQRKLTLLNRPWQKKCSMMRRHRAAWAAVTMTRRRKSRSSRPVLWRRSVSSWAVSLLSFIRPAVRPSTR